jgi:hypothetical protein
MAYIAFADLRTATLAEYCSGISLGTADASDANITSAIARFSQRFDDYTNDHFEAEAITLTLTGDGTPRLLLPKRCTAITAIALTDTAGNSTTQTSTVYRLHSSLYSSGSKRLYELDYVELIYGAGGLVGYPFDHWNMYTWPCDTNSISVTGSFGWNTTPGDVKRAVALMVYDHFKPMDASLHRTQSFTTEKAAINLSASQPTGIPECDDIIAAYKRVVIPTGIA